LHDVLDTATPRADHGAWDILRSFATSDMSLPEAEEQLKTHLGDQYNDSDWRPALDAVMKAEGDAVQAQAAIHKLASGSQLPRLTIRIPGNGRPKHSDVAPQLAEAEKLLTESVEELVRRKRIIGPPPTIEDLLDPVEEREIVDSGYRFEGGDVEIVAEVKQEMAVKSGEIIELDDSDSDPGDDEDVLPSRREVIKLCETLKRVCLTYSGENFSLDLPRHLRKFRAELLHKEFQNNTQTSLVDYFSVETRR
jgi:hypothetical protein